MSSLRERQIEALKSMLDLSPPSAGGLDAAEPTWKVGLKVFRIRIRMDPNLFGSLGSGSIFGMGILVRIQEQGNRPKLANKPHFQSLKMASSLDPDPN
jgi:hypothetical protein